MYSFWASMMTRILSLVEAVDGEIPTSSRNDFAILRRAESHSGRRELLSRSVLLGRCFAGIYREILYIRLLII